MSAAVSTLSAGVASVLKIVFLLYAMILQSDAECNFPGDYQGDWYGLALGQDVHVTMSGSKLTVDSSDATCREQAYQINPDQKGETALRMLLYFPQDQCYNCFEFTKRTTNVIQYKRGRCISDERTTMNQACMDISPTSDIHTLFRKDAVGVNCKTLFYGVYGLEMESSASLENCENDRNRLTACQEPGSPYINNEVFTLNMPGCQFLQGRTRYVCLGTWRAQSYGFDYYWGAVMDVGDSDLRTRYRCLLTQGDVMVLGEKRRFVMSRFASCSTLRSPYEGDIRMVVTPVLPEPLVSSCNLPWDLKGEWMSTVDIASKFNINDTTIAAMTTLNQVTSRQVYHSCRLHQESKFLMSTSTVGDCDVRYTCFRFDSRRGNFITWKSGRSIHNRHFLMPKNDALMKLFNDACDDVAFAHSEEFNQIAVVGGLLSDRDQMQCSFKTQNTQYQGKEQPDDVLLMAGASFSISCLVYPWPQYKNVDFRVLKSSPHPDSQLETILNRETFTDDVPDRYSVNVKVSGFSRQVTLTVTNVTIVDAGKFEVRMGDDGTGPRQAWSLDVAEQPGSIDMSFEFSQTVNSSVDTINFKPVENNTVIAVEQGTHLTVHCETRAAGNDGVMVASVKGQKIIKMLQVRPDRVDRPGPFDEDETSVRSRLAFTGRWLVTCADQDAPLTCHAGAPSVLALRTRVTLNVTGCPTGQSENFSDEFTIKPDKPANGGMTDHPDRMYYLIPTLLLLVWYNINLRQLATFCL